MTREEMKNRLKVFAVRVIKLVDKLPNTPAGRAIGSQVVRSGTSPGANYRAACIGKSDKDFLNKLKMVEAVSYTHLTLPTIKLHIGWS